MLGDVYRFYNGRYIGVYLPVSVKRRLQTADCRLQSAFYTDRFIYTGSVQISTEDNAQELVAMADYLFLPHLKTLAGSVLVQKLDASNCISIYLFGQMYRCDELTSGSKKFIFENFTTVAKSEDFLNISSKELEMWISSDEINVSAEEDVFEIILMWINNDKVQRKEYFSELFRHVRLVYVSRDYVHTDIITNDFVKDNEDCLEHVQNAVKVTASKSYHELSFTPRKSLETPVIVVCRRGVEKGAILCYFPREDTWCTLFGYDSPGFSGHSNDLLSSHGKLYFVNSLHRRIHCYDWFLDSWESLPINKGKTFPRVFVRNEDEIYAMVSESCPRCAYFLGQSGRSSRCEKRHLSTITRYNPESNSWTDISSFDLGPREGICIVAKDNYTYFIGGITRDMSLTNADKYDLEKNKWDKIAEIQEPRIWPWARCAVVHGNIFITGGINFVSNTCEVYDETTNEWQFIASLNIPSGYRRLICVDGSLYVMGESLDKENQKIERYDPEKNKWIEKTKVPIEKMYPDTDSFKNVTACSARIFKGTRLQQYLSSYKDE